MNNQQRSNIKVGLNVAVVKKEHQRSGELTCGIVQKILTKSAIHPHGIKVMLETGEVGRVQKIMQES
nr:YwbE family protein [uncultured Draconibacterium sp.]